MRAFHLLETFDRVNLGVLNSAQSTAPHMAALGWDLHFFGQDVPAGAPDHWHGHTRVNELARERMPDIVISHGNWTWATRKAAQLARRRGIPWVVFPQGMLEPWAMGHKAWKKQLYYQLVEHRLLRSAGAIVAASQPEYGRLLHMFSAVHYVPNSVDMAPPQQPHAKEKVFLFLGRLNEKKGVLPLIEAWKNASVKGYRLVIVGPDDGQEAAVRRAAAQVDTIDFRGAVFGQEKQQLQERAQFFVLPSHSEGLPMSALEATAAGCIPLLSPGCNLPELDEAGLNIALRPDTASITAALQRAASLSDDELRQWQMKLRAYIFEHFSAMRMAQQEDALYRKLIGQP